MAHMLLEPSIERDEHIETTTRFAALPNPVTVCPYDIHDIASTFKLFLGELHGGILGSVDLFDSLRKGFGMPLVEDTTGHDEGWDFLCRGITHDDERANLKWVASSLANVQCRQRRNVIFAVFGLLAHVKHDRLRPRDSFFPSPPERHAPYMDMDTAAALGFTEMLQDRGKKPGADNMSSKSLATVFAPLLLGNLTDDIRIDLTGPALAHAIEAHSHFPAGAPRKKSLNSASMVSLQHQSLDMSSGFDVSQHTNSAIDLTEHVNKTIDNSHVLADGDSNITPPFLEPRLSYPALARDLPKGAWKIKHMVKREETLDPTFIDELEEAKMRNSVAITMCESLIGNWEGIIQEVRAMRRIGDRYGNGRC
jgi:hypothetical protein